MGKGGLEDGDTIMLRIGDPNTTVVKGEIIKLVRDGNVVRVTEVNPRLGHIAQVGQTFNITNSSSGKDSIIYIGNIGLKKGPMPTSAAAGIHDKANNWSNEARDGVFYEGTGSSTKVIYGESIYEDVAAGLVHGLLGDNALKASKLASQLTGDHDFKIDVKVILANAIVETGDGDDYINIHQSGGGWGSISGGATVNLGGGNDKLTIARDIDNATITTGSGDDVVSVGNYITNRTTVDLGDGNDQLIVKTNIDSSTITTGSGDDLVSVGNYIHNSTVNLGDGNDTLTVGRMDLTNSRIDGGTGYDKLVITDRYASDINVSNIAKYAKNFEEIVSKDGNKTTLNLKLGDIIDLTDNNNTLKITGESGDRVNFNDSGWHKGAQVDGYTEYTNHNNHSVKLLISDEVYTGL